MAVSTHRWRPSFNIKSGYSLRKNNKKGKSSKTTEHCLIEMKFENSSYFLGVTYPVSIYTLTKPSETLLKQSIMTSGRRSSIAFNESIHQAVHKKLYATEYVDAKSVKYLTKLKNPLIRSYIITDDRSFLEDAIAVVELIKLSLDTALWESLRIIVVSKNYDVRMEILRRGAMLNKQATKPFAMIKPKVESLISEDDDDEMEEENREDNYTEDNDSMNTTFDEDAETRMISSIASSKFRDSRIILTNKKKNTPQPDIDPIERCFTALMKMMEDNIFSASKGLNEVNSQIEQMLKDDDIDSIEIMSDDMNVEFD